MTDVSSVAAVDEPDVDAVAAAALACPDVVALTSAGPGALATYLPGRRVFGVRVTAETLEISVVGRYGPTMAELGEQVTAAVAPLAPGRSIVVHVSDLAVDQDEPEEIPEHVGN